MVTILDAFSFWTANLEQYWLSVMLTPLILMSAAAACVLCTSENQCQLGSHVGYLNMEALQNQWFRLKMMWSVLYLCLEVPIL